MKILASLLVIVVFATSCGPDSSPEKRLNIKNQDLEQKINTLAQQQQALRDSISAINKKLNALKPQQ